MDKFDKYLVEAYGLDRAMYNIRKKNGQLPDKKYPELDSIAKDMADDVYTSIGKRTTKVDSEMPYKAQYVLEKIIENLKKMV